MFDGFKISVLSQHTFNCLLKNPRLSFVEHHNIKTQEISYTTKFRKLVIELLPSGKTRIRGSLHKFYNEGHHNWDDFTHSKLKESLILLQSDLNIDLQDATLNNLEFGVNISPSFSPNMLINDLLCFKWNQFDNMNIPRSGLGRECRSFNHYSVKIYNKGLQYKLPQQLLRIEKKVTTMINLQREEIRLIDLLDVKLWEHCRKELIKMVNEIIFYEPIDSNKISKNQLKIYSSVINQRNWVNFTPNKKMRYKRGFNEIILNYGKMQYREAILQMINEKFEELLYS